MRLKVMKRKKEATTDRNGVFLISGILSLRWGLGILGLEHIHLYGIEEEGFIQERLDRFLDQ